MYQRKTAARSLYLLVVVARSGSQDLFLFAFGFVTTAAMYIVEVLLSSPTRRRSSGRGRASTQPLCPVVDSWISGETG
jgi:hypothetical protein